MPQGVDPKSQEQVLVVGGGAIGLAVARQLAGSGWSVTLLERGQPGQAASHAAAGMLAPHLEFHANPTLLAVGERARDLYPGYVRELEAETGSEVDLRLQGTLKPDGHPDANTDSIPAGAERLDGPALRAAEPGLHTEIQGALLFPNDGSIDNRSLVHALLQSCRRRGVTILPERKADAILIEEDRVRGVRVGKEIFPCTRVVNCCGAWASQLPVPGGELAVRPIKGQMLRLRRGEGEADGPRHTIYGNSSYLVPRSDGDVIVGTTVEDRGFETRIEAGAIARLLDGALRLYPNLASARFVDAWAGLRPRAENELPTVGPLGPSGHFIAAGHFRNGILFAPLTARAVDDHFAGRRTEATESFVRTPDCLSSDRS